jgi:8-oxo-dGTP pyrophosphatase MutT (NUDIX family)
MAQDNAWRTLSSEIAYKGKWLTVRVDRVLRPDGSQGTYELIDKKDFVVIIPRIDDLFYLVEQYRYAVGAKSWEFPQGGCDDEIDLETCAKKELEEELGLKALSLVSLGNLWMATGNSTQGCEVFLVEDVIPGKQRLEESESDLQWRTFTEDEIVEMIKDGRIRSSNTIAAFNLYLLKR